MAEKKTPGKSTGKKINIKYLGGVLLKKMMRGGARMLGKNAEEVNKLNVFPVPDGDTGDNMRMTIESGVSAIENIDSDNLADVMEALSRGMLLGARGNSGVILSQFFAGIAKGLETSKKADPETLGAALELGVKHAYSSVMTPTEGTILTVARESVEYAVKRINEKSTIRSFFDDLLKEMQASLKRTPEILSVLKEAMVVDSGGAGLLYIMAGFAQVLNGEEIGDEPEPIRAAPSATPACDPITAFGPDSEMEYGYCTELLIQLLRKKTDLATFDIEKVKAFLAANGDSVVAVHSDGVVKLHVHTFEPEKILAYGRQFGELLRVKIENMSVQHSELSEREGAAPSPTPTAPKKPYGVVAVANGDGLEALFRELGADEVIRGGQTHNPSTQEFLDAFHRISAEHILVFPNNGNILMAAEQAAELYEEARIHVIPSKSIGTGYVALASANYESPDADALCAELLEAIDRTVAGYVSTAIRDADLSGVHIEKEDAIGIIGKEIVVSEKKRTDAFLALADRMLGTGERSVLTVFCGMDAPGDEVEALSAELAEKYPDAEVYFMEGGQEIYSYVLAAE